MLTLSERKCTRAQQLSWVLRRGMWIGVVQRRPVHHLAQECVAPIKRTDRGLSLSECSVPPDSYKTPGSISRWQHRDNEREKEDQLLAEAAHLPPLSSWGGRMHAPLPVPLYPALWTQLCLWILQKAVTGLISVSWVFERSSQGPQWSKQQSPWTSLCLFLPFSVHSALPSLWLMLTVLHCACLAGHVCTDVKSKAELLVIWKNKLAV